MKRQAYTLTEVLITLGVIGVLSAILLPMANKLKPDTNKIMYLKMYDSLKEATSQIINDESYYTSSVDLTNRGGYKYNIAEYPLLDTYTPKNINGNVVSGTTAFPLLLREAFGGTDNNGSFTTKTNNMTVSINANTQNEHILTGGNGDDTTLFYTVEVDINGNEGPNSFYNPQNQNLVPDRFRFIITSTGKVIASDVYGQLYLNSRTNFQASETTASDRRTTLNELSAKTAENIEEIEIKAVLREIAENYSEDNDTESV